MTDNAMFEREPFTCRVRYSSGYITTLRFGRILTRYRLQRYRRTSYFHENKQPKGETK